MKKLVMMCLITIGLLSSVAFAENRVKQDTQKAVKYAKDCFV